MKPSKRTAMKTTVIPIAVATEIRRLAAIHPLLSPTAGWSKLKGLHSIETRLELNLDAKLNLHAKVHPALDIHRVNPLWAQDADPSVRKEVDRAFRGLLATVTQMATAALKPAGWKLKAADHQNSHAVAMVWTRKGREVALLAYAAHRLPGISWRNTGKKRNWMPSEPNNYHTDVCFLIATPKRSPEVLAEVCTALSGIISTRNESAKFSIPREHGNSKLYGMPQVHFCRSANGDGLSPQHRKLIESLRGKVCFVDFQGGRGGYLPAIPAYVILPSPTPHVHYLDDAKKDSWGHMAELPPRSIRLVAVGDDGRMKWCETFGPDEAVPAATVKRLLASSHYSNGASRLEKEAIYHSTKA